MWDQLRLPINDAEDSVPTDLELRRWTLQELAPTVDADRDLSKAAIRARHRASRIERGAAELATLGSAREDLLRDFAAGHEVDPDRVRPVLSVVQSGTRDAVLFRLACLLWSVPVSRGYGRRMRFLVRDEHNGRLIGLFALGDPVFNLAARDAWVGWTQEDRRQRLTSVMDAYVAGAVPPYSRILGGKLVFSLVASTEVAEAFRVRYAGRAGTISGSNKNPVLALVSVMSALGRSSIYNRLRLVDPSSGTRVVDLQPVGWTKGYGHFQISNRLFLELRRFLGRRNHRYADGYRFGDGPNWRMRVVRVALSELGLDTQLLRHGLAREVFLLPLLANSREYLVGSDDAPALDGRRSVSEIGELATQRWLIPRSKRDPSFRDFSDEDLRRLFDGVASRG